MLFFDEDQLDTMRYLFAVDTWPGYNRDFLLQEAPETLSSYEVYRFDGQAWGRETTTNACFAAWIITGNAVGHALWGDEAHLEAGLGWVKAALKTDPWLAVKPYESERSVDRKMMFFSHLAYALGFFIDMCGDAMDTDTRREAEAILKVHLREALDRLEDISPNRRARNHSCYFIPLSAILTASMALREDHEEASGWANDLSDEAERVFDSLPADGYFSEGYAQATSTLIWVVRMAEICRRHFSFRMASNEFFRNVGRFFHWLRMPGSIVPLGSGDDSGPRLRYERWEERPSGFADANGARFADYSHALNWITWATEDPFSREVANSLAQAGAVPQEGFWALAWTFAEGEATLPGGEHHFEDRGTWVADREHAGQTIRLMARCGLPCGQLFFHKSDPEQLLLGLHAHPDAGSVFAAIGDTPIIAAPGSLGSKRTTFLNTYTFGGIGQCADRLYTPASSDVVDMTRLLDLALQKTETGAIRMTFAAGYMPDAGIRRAWRHVNWLPDAPGFQIEDFIVTTQPLFAECRFRIAAPPAHSMPDSVEWEVSGHRMKMTILECTAEYQIFAFPGEVVSINDEDIGPAEAGPTCQRGYQLMIRPLAPGKRFDIKVRFELI